MLRISFLFLLLAMTFQIQAEEKLKCFNAAEWANACIHRQMKDGFKGSATLVDVKFLGEDAPALSDNWMLKNYPTLVEATFKFDEESRITQNGCKSLTSKDSTVLEITGSSAHHLDLTLSPESLTKNKSAVEVLIISAMLSHFKFKMEEIPERPNSLRLNLTQVTDNQLVQSFFIFNCGDKLPEKETVSKSAVELKARYDKLIADGVKETPEPEETKEIAFINKKGKIIYLEKNQDDLKKEYEDAFEKYAAEKNLKIKDLSSEKTAQLQNSFIKEKGPSLSVGARYLQFNELRMARLLLFPKDEAKLVESTPELKGKLKEIREQVKETQKLIAMQLDMPEGYWNYPDQPNDFLDMFAEALGKALGEAVEKMGEGIIDGLKKGLNPPPKEPMPML